MKNELIAIVDDDLDVVNTISGRLEGKVLRPGVFQTVKNCLKPWIRKNPI